MGDGFVTRFPLPETGTVRIGRAEGLEIRIDDPSLSRHHATLSLGRFPTIEDQGSANGTKVGERSLGKHERAIVSPGEVIQLGALIAVITKGEAVDPPARPLWTHERFLAHLEEICAEARRTRSGFALARVMIDPRQKTPLLEKALENRLGPRDCLGSVAPGELEILLLDADAKVLDEATAAISGPELRVDRAILRWPEDGTKADELVARSFAALHGASKESAPIVLDPAMIELYRVLDRVAPSDVNVLILGDTGVGKEVLAQALHQRSARKSGPMVELNCAALSESLLESELFGHEKGAFTGALESKDGLLASAEGGTVFLDEVGELPAAVQAKLLRVIEQRQVLRVGSLRPRPIDVRFVAATNRDLEEEVAAGRFRRDLYFRLNGISLEVPPLAERPSEIAPLARAFVAGAARRLQVPAPAIAPAALAQLEAQPWPGNIRELKNVMERAVLLADAEIRVEHLPAPAPLAAAPPPSAKLSPEHAQERDRIVAALAECQGNQTQAAKKLGMSRGTLLMRMDAYRIERPRKRSPL